MKYSIFPLKSTFSLIASIAVLLYSNSAIAAERVVLKYNIFRTSISVDELANFAETGQVSPTLNYYLNQSRQEPETVRRILSQEINANPVVLDRVLNNRIGEFLLDRISQSVSTPSSQASRQALRSAIVLSANKGNRVSLIEILQNYPTSEVVVDGERLAQTYNQLYILATDLQRILNLPTSLN
jgi:hypothetical protein